MGKEQAKQKTWQNTEGEIVWTQTFSVNVLPLINDYYRPSSHCCSVECVLYALRIIQCIMFSGDMLLCNRLGHLDSVFLLILKLNSTNWSVKNEIDRTLPPESTSSAVVKLKRFDDSFFSRTFNFPHNLSEEKAFRVYWLAVHLENVFSFHFKMASNAMQFLWTFFLDWSVFIAFFLINAENSDVKKYYRVRN